MMKIKNTILENKHNLEQGNINTIPLPYKGTKKVLSGIYPGALSCITAESGVGKTTFAKHMYIFNVANLIIENPIFKHLNYKCLWFGLEESFEEFECSILQHALSRYHNTYVSQDMLLSRINPLPDNIIKLIETEKVQLFYNLCLKITDFQDNISNPTGIYKHCRNYSEEIGSHKNKIIKIKNVNTEIYSHYEQNDINQIVSVVIDNVNILTTEKNHLGVNLSLDGTIDLMVNHYMRNQVTKHWKWHVCCIQQQKMAGGDIQYLKLDRLEPDKQKLGDNLKVARSYQIILGLFSPYAHRKPKYLNYPIASNSNTNGFEDFYRSLHVIKNRFGRSGTVESLFFNPLGFDFISLPKFDNHNISEFLNLKNEIVNGK